MPTRNISKLRVLPAIFANTGAATAPPEYEFKLGLSIETIIVRDFSSAGAMPTNDAL